MQGDIKVKVVKSRRKTLSVSVDRMGNVTVRAPLYYTDAGIRRFVASREGWIREVLAKREEKRGDAEPFSPEEIQRMKELARKVIPERVEYYARLMGLSYNRVTIKCLKSRWGSCSSKGNLNFNCLLMMVPGEVMDYVVVHELCHIKQMNHSRKFWAEVAKVLPMYRIQRRWLKEHGTVLITRMIEGREE